MAKEMISKSQFAKVYVEGVKSGKSLAQIAGLLGKSADKKGANYVSVRACALRREARGAAAAFIKSQGLNADSEQAKAILERAESKYPEVGPGRTKGSGSDELNSEFAELLATMNATQGESETQGETENA